MAPNTTIKTPILSIFLLRSPISRIMINLANQSKNISFLDTYKEESYLWEKTTKQSKNLWQKTKYSNI